MRLSWYADTGVAVFSIWQGGRCTGTFRLPLSDLPRMAETLRRGPDDSGRGRDDYGRQAAGGYAAQPGPAGNALTGQYLVPIEPTAVSSRPVTAAASHEQGGGHYPDYAGYLPAGPPESPGSAAQAGPAHQDGQAYPDHPAHAPAGSYPRFPPAAAPGASGHRGSAASWAAGGHPSGATEPAYTGRTVPGGVRLGAAGPAAADVGTGYPQRAPATPAESYGATGYPRPAAAAAEPYAATGYPGSTPARPAEPYGSTGYPRRQPARAAEPYEATGYPRRQPARAAEPYAGTGFPEATMPRAAESAHPGLGYPASAAPPPGPEYRSGAVEAPGYPAAAYPPRGSAEFPAAEAAGSAHPGSRYPDGRHTPPVHGADFPPAGITAPVYPGASGQHAAPANAPASYPAAAAGAVSAPPPGYSDEPLTDPYSAMPQRRGYGDAELANITLG